MSLPKDLLDQLLTGYLDDALTADERARFEQLLQSDPQIADELTQLRGLGQSLKAIARSDSAIKLDDGFSDRVIGAAVARAHAEGLGDDHPLVRLSEQPLTTTTRSTAARSQWRLAAVLVGLAASIAIAVISLRPDPREAQGFAGVNPQANIPAPDESPRVTPNAAIEDSGAATPEMVASSNEPSPNNVAVDSAASNHGTPAIESPENTNSVEPKRSVTPGPAESIAASENPAMNSTESPAVNKVNPPTQIGTLLVLDVRRTAAGRASGAVQSAMREADIDAAGKKQITDEIAGYVSDETDAASSQDSVSVLYLQVPGKQFARFHQSLWADQEGIESVRMMLAFDAPFMKVVDAVRRDPTTVQHDSAAFELSSNNGVVDKLASELGELDFPPMKNRGNAPISLPVSAGPDIPAEVLVLVR